MCEFATRGNALLTTAGDVFSRLLACALPAATFRHGEFGISAAFALFAGAIDGYARLWGSCTSRSFVAGPEGLTTFSGSKARLVPWPNVLAMRTWHHHNHIDYLAIYYWRAGRMEVASCLDWYAEDELRAFVQACADHVSADSPRRSIPLPGLCEQGVYLPLFRRFTQDVTLATLVGYATGALGTAFLLGVIAASLSALVSAIRCPFRTTTFVQQDGLWCSQGVKAGPLRTIPRPLRLWVRSLAEAAYEQAGGVNRTSTGCNSVTPPKKISGDLAGDHPGIADATKSDEHEEAP